MVLGLQKISLVVWESLKGFYKILITPVPDKASLIEPHHFVLLSMTSILGGRLKRCNMVLGMKSKPCSLGKSERIYKILITPVPDKSKSY